MVQQTVTESSVVKRKQRQPQKAPKSTKLVETNDSDTEDGEEDQKTCSKKKTGTAPKITKVPRAC